MKCQIVASALIVLIAFASPASAQFFGSWFGGHEGFGHGGGEFPSWGGNPGFPGGGVQPGPVVPGNPGHPGEPGPVVPGNPGGPQPIPCAGNTGAQATALCTGAKQAGVINVNVPIGNCANIFSGNQGSALVGVLSAFGSGPSGPTCGNSGAAATSFCQGAQQTGIINVNLSVLNCANIFSANQNSALAAVGSNFGGTGRFGGFGR